MWWLRKKQDDSNNPGVYRIRNTLTGVEYIGATNQPMYKRWEQHLSQLRRHRHSNTRLQADWNVYGEQTFLFSVIEVVTDGHSRVFEREVYWQDKDYSPHQRYNPPNEARSLIELVADNPNAPFEWRQATGGKQVRLLKPEVKKSTIWLALARLVFAGLVTEDAAVEVIDQTLQERNIIYSLAEIRTRLRQEWL